MTEQPTPQEVYDQALAALTGTQRRFVVEYLQCLNASEAARRAGYKTKPNVQGSRMLANASIKAAISAGMALHVMEPSEVLFRLRAQAQGSMGDFLRVDEEEIIVETSVAILTDAERLMLAMGGSKRVKQFIADHPEPIESEDDEEDAKPVPKVVRITTATVKRAVARLDLLQAADKLHLIKKYTLDDKGKVSIELYDAQAANRLIGQHHSLFVERHEHSGPNGGPIEIDDARDQLTRLLTGGVAPGNAATEATGNSPT